MRTVKCKFPPTPACFERTAMAHYFCGVAYGKIATGENRPCVRTGSVPRENVEAWNDLPCVRTGCGEPRRILRKCTLVAQEHAAYTQAVCHRICNALEYDSLS